MSKAVMISIRPKWCEKICSGEKTIEVRKSRPKLEPPFKCYIYCTQASVRYQTICGCHVLNSDELYRHPEQGIKHGYSIELMLCENYTKDNFLNGKVIGEFTCDRIYKIDKDSTDFLFKAGGLSVYKQAAEEKCGLCVAMTDDELHDYLEHYQGYGWHISDLNIYDKPKRLDEFTFLRETKFGSEPVTIKRPPQSWFYVEEVRCLN
jgi:predicted transcriptional regulator|nr:MAG TPA: hypothetical protein [Caudoviricetes sp.]